MKNSHALPLRCVAALFAGLALAAWPCQASVATVELEAQPMVVGAGMPRVIDQPGQALMVKRGGALTVTSDDNVVVIEAGGTASITGGGNRVYVHAGGALMIPESAAGNQVYAIPPPGGITMSRRNNKLTVVRQIKLQVRKPLPLPPPAPEPPMADPPPPPPVVAANPDPVAPPPPPAGLAEPASLAPGFNATPGALALGDLIGNGDMLKQAVPSLWALLQILPADGIEEDLRAIALPDLDPANPLIGSWDVTGSQIAEPLARTMGVKLGGKFVFLPGGAGYTRLTVGLGGKESERRGKFTWKADDTTLVINQGRPNESRWSRVKNTPDEQTARIGEDRQAVTLEMTRSRAE
jgi:hypothetical protein